MTSYIDYLIIVLLKQEALSSVYEWWMTWNCGHSLSDSSWEYITSECQFWQIIVNWLPNNWQKEVKTRKEHKKIVHESKNWLDGIINVNAVIAERIFVKHSV